MDVTLRPHRAGDLGWTLYRQAAVYAEEFGYSPIFERYVADSVAAFMAHYDPACDRLWMAEADGAVVGFVAIQHAGEPPGWAKLRWFLVEPEARGKGVGRRLMDAALAFARDAGYQGVMLWTVDDLHAARRLYEAAGFSLAFQDDAPCPWAPWGHEQRWELELIPTATP